MSEHINSEKMMEEFRLLEKEAKVNYCKKHGKLCENCDNDWCSCYQKKVEVKNG